MESFHIDIKIKALFDRVEPDTTRETYKRFTTKQVNKCKKYVNQLEKYLAEAKIGTKTAELRKEKWQDRMHLRLI